MDEFVRPADSALTLRTARLTLRPVARSDAAVLFPHCANPELSRFMTWSAHGTIGMTEEFVATSIASRHNDCDYVWCIFEEGAFRGLVGIEGVNRGRTPVRVESAELGYWLGMSFHGRGLGTEAASAVLGYGFSRLRLHKVTSTAFTTNSASLRVLEKLGFRRIGTRYADVHRDGAWHDQHVFELLETDETAMAHVAASNG
jgi:ribosomal-protein-alanine N-acetyltransferase